MTNQLKEEKRKLNKDRKVVEGSVLEKMLKQRKPQWAINQIEYYIDVKEDQIRFATKQMQEELERILNKHVEMFLEEAKEAINKIRDEDLGNWSGGNWLDCEVIQGRD
jgi:hypothetical protein